MKKSLKKTSNKNKKIKGWIFWIPRILSILFLLFLAMFSLDVFGNNYTFWETILGLFMHNIPVFILAILLWISWKRELVGAIVFALAGILYIAQLLFNSAMHGFQWYYLVWSLEIAGPAFVVAFLWYLNWKKKR